MKITPFRLDSASQAQSCFAALGVSSEGIKILAPKAVLYVFKISDIRSWEANIIKQEMLSLGGDAALNRAVLVKDCRTDIVIFGTLSQLKKLCAKLLHQPFDLGTIGCELLLLLDKKTNNLVWRVGGKKLILKRPLVCGILNITPDSFSNDGLLKEKDWPEAALRRAQAMFKAGADMLDIGAESTRPFSKPIGAKEEIRRIIPVIKIIRRKFPKALISIDSYRHATCAACLDYGINIINDISALTQDKKMAGLICKAKLGCVLMHMHGSPADMQIKPHYDDVVEDITAYLEGRIGFCRQAGIDITQLAIDPGIGFGKSVKDNLRLIAQLDRLAILGRPLFVGLSRKSFVAKTLNIEENRLVGTLAATLMAVNRGAQIIRTHDVLETVQALTMMSAIKEEDEF